MVQTGKIGQNGQDGYTPVKGTDYFTPSEIANIENDIKNDIKPLVFYWDGSTDSTGLEFWNTVYEAQKTQPCIVFHTKRMGAIYTTFSWSYANNMPTSVFDTVDSNVYSRIVATHGQSSGFNNLGIYVFQLYFTISNDEVTAINQSSYADFVAYISATENYSQPYTPIYNSSPANKKYVDDSITSAITDAIGGAY